MKKLYILLQAMLFCVVSAHAQTFTVDEISYGVTKQATEESLGEVQVTGGEIKEEIVIPETVTYDDVTYMVTSIGENAFRGRYDLNNFTRKYVIPSTVRTIGNHAFYDNYYLEEVEFNEGLLTIDAGAFEYNFALKEIRIPSTVTAIAENVFHTDRQNLATICCLAEAPPSIQSNTFGGRTDAVLHVLETEAEAYREAENWKNFSEILGDMLYSHRCYSPVFTIEDGLITMSSKTEGSTIYYTTNGSVPDENAIRYTSPIPYITTQIIRAIAIAEGLENSAIRTLYDKETIERITNVTDEQGLCYLLVRAEDGSYYYSVTGHTDGMSSEIFIPADLNGYPVKIIEGSVFYGCTSLSSITIPSSVISIGTGAFQGCTSLSSITIPSSIISIGDWAFQGCTSLSSITIPSSVISIGTEAFQGCTSLSSITIPSSIITIGDWAFQDCSGLTSITIPNSVTSVGAGVFQGCSNLATVRLGSQLSTIEDHMFYGCTSLLSVTIPNSVTTIDDWAFTGCSGLPSITIPNSVTTIGARVFQGCNNLTTVRLGSQLSTIGDYAFHDCTSLSSINIPDNVTSIGEFAFLWCSSLTSVTIGSGVTSLKAGTFHGCSNLTTITIPGNVTSIEDAVNEYNNGLGHGYRNGPYGVFTGCSGLTSVTIGDGVSYIGSRVFYGGVLTSITIPNSVTGFGVGAFEDNKSLTTLNLGDGITEIASDMFKNCELLSSVIIPNGVTTIGSSAFWGCRALTSIKLPESLTSMGDDVFLFCPMKSIELPNSFTIIPENQFSRNDFQYIKLGNNVKSIGKNAFGSSEPVIEIATSTPPTISNEAFPYVEYLSDLNVIVPNAAAETAYRKAAVWQEMTFSNQDNVSEVTVETPGDLSFDLIIQCNMMPAKVVGLKVNGAINADDFTQMLVNMKSLLRLDLTDCDITEIPDEALKGKQQLKEVVLPTTLQTIGQSAFQDCTFLQDLTLQAGLQTIGQSAFQNCTSLQELTLQTGLQTIGQSAFQNCIGLTGELSLPSTVTTIGASAFVGTGCTSVKMPNALKAINDYAFYNVPISQRLVLPGRLQSVGVSAFEGTKINGLVIPDGVTSIGDRAFADTPIQGHVTIPDGVTYLGTGAFSNSQLSTVFLPNSIETLSQGLFQGCPNLDLVYVPDNYTGVSGNAFDGCGSLQVLRLSANLASMGEYSFQNTPLEYLKVPSQVETLSKGTLKNCRSLESLTLPANMKTVETEALYGCTALRNLSVEAVTPPVIKDRNAIRGINTDKCLISIPTTAYRAYVLAEYWGQFVQMRNDIAVETVGNGEIAFESVEEEEDEEVSESRQSGGRRAAARAPRRAPQLASDDETMTYANNGSSVYVPQQGQVRFYIIPTAGEELLSATLDGEDIMPYIVDNVYTATADKKNAKLVVKFSGDQGTVATAGDVNGDGDVDIADAVQIVNHVVGKATPQFVAEAADVNSDGDVDIADAVRIVNLVVGKITSLSRLMNFFQLDPQ